MHAQTLLMKHIVHVLYMYMYVHVDVSDSFLTTPILLMVGGGICR